MPNLKHLLALGTLGGAAALALFRQMGREGDSSTSDAPFQDQVVIVTGASTGIGRELALQLAAQQARVVLAARNREQLEEVARGCAANGAQVLVVPTDVGDEAQCRALVERTVAEFGRLDMLINNAGISMWARFEELTNLAPFEQMMRINYLGSVYCTHAALPHLRQARGRLVAVSSLSGRTGVPTRSGYAATKHAMVGFFDSLRIELAGSGVSVTVIYPGFVATEIRERATGADGQPLGAGNSPVQEGEIMSAQECARQILQAAAGRERELVMTLRGRVGAWFKLLAPALVDQVALRTIERGK